MKKSKQTALKLALGIATLTAVVPTVVTSCTWAYKKDEPGPTPPGPAPETFYTWEELDEYATEAHNRPTPLDKTWTISANDIEAIAEFENEVMTDAILLDGMFFYAYYIGQSLEYESTMGGDRGTLNSAKCTVTNEGNNKVCTCYVDTTIATTSFVFELKYVFRPDGENKFHYMDALMKLNGVTQVDKESCLVGEMDYTDIYPSVEHPVNLIRIVYDPPGGGENRPAFFLPWYDFLDDSGKTRITIQKKK